MKYKCIQCGKTFKEEELNLIKEIVSSQFAIKPEGKNPYRYDVICNDCADIDKKEHFVNAGGGNDEPTKEK